MQLLNKVRDYLKKEKRYDFADEKWTGEMLGIVYDAVYATEAVMSEDKSSQWISVEDRLPEINQNVLVIRTNPNVVTNGYIHERGHWIWSNLRGSTHKADGFHAITHWMPMPSPPQQ